MYLSHEQVAATAAVNDVDDLTVPAKATHAELQADTSDIRYTMDNATDPTQTSGMILLTTEDPMLFLIEDINRIRFTRGSGSNGNLNVHYVAGRDI